MRSTKRILLGGLMAVALQAPLHGLAQEQIVPSPPPPPSTVAPRPAMPPAIEKPATRSEGTAPGFRPPAAQILRPQQQLPAGPEKPGVTRQAAPGTGRPADAGDASSCPQELTTQCREAKAAELLYARQYYESLGRDLELRQQAFEWHAFSTKALFWCVLTITGVGLALSWREFGKYYEGKRPAGAKGTARADAGPGESAPGAPPQSVFKVGAQGLEVTSSLIGFLVLSVSLAFFYLYVVNVYPLYEIAAAQATSASAKPGDGTAATK